MSQTPALNPDSTPKSADRSQWVFVGFSLAIVVAVAALRLVASWDDFWFDEIWSWKFASETSSLWEIATRVRHDNNHILNTWVVHLLGTETHWTVYRLPAVLAGIGTVVLAGLCGWRRSPCEGLTALLLTGGSFVFIQYASEARGYAYLLFFTMLCVWLMERVTVAPRLRDELLFAVSASLGFLSHFSFAAAYSGFVVWSAVSAIRCHRSWNARIFVWFKRHALPLATFAGLACWNLPHMVIGGGNRLRLGEVLIRAGSLAVGGPDGGWLAVVVCCVGIVASVAGAILLFRNDEGAFYFCAGSMATFALFVLVAKPDVIYVRYALIQIACVILALSHLLARVWRVRRWAHVVVVGAILGGNAVHITPFLRWGRGGYREAVALMQAASVSPSVTVGSDHDFRNPMILHYYQNRLVNPKPLVYYPNGRWPEQGPEWIILHSFQQPLKPRPEIQDAAGNRYRLVRVYPFAGLSGWAWWLYQRRLEVPKK